MTDASEMLIQYENWLDEILWYSGPDTPPRKVIALIEQQAARIAGLEAENATLQGNCEFLQQRELAEMEKASTAADEERDRIVVWLKEREAARASRADLSSSPYAIGRMNSYAHAADAISRNEHR